MGGKLTACVVRSNLRKYLKYQPLIYINTWYKSFATDSAPKESSTHFISDQIKSYFYGDECRIIFWLISGLILKLNHNGLNVEWIITYVFHVNKKDSTVAINLWSNCK